MYCPNCGKDIGDFAFCDNCGYTKNVSSETSNRINRKKPILKYILILAVVIIGILVLKGIYDKGSSNSTKSYPSESSVSETEPASSSDYYEPIHAKQIIDEMNDNSLRAEKNYLGKQLAITGIIDDFDINGNSFTISNNQFLSFDSIKCYIKNTTTYDKIVLANEGDLITVFCEVTKISDILGKQLTVDAYDIDLGLAGLKSNLMGKKADQLSINDSAFVEKKKISDNLTLFENNNCYIYGFSTKIIIVADKEGNCVEIGFSMNTKTVDDEMMAPLISDIYYYLKEQLGYPEYKTNEFTGSNDSAKELLYKEIHAQWTEEEYGAIDYKKTENILFVAYGNSEFCQELLKANNSK